MPVSLTADSFTQHPRVRAALDTTLAQCAGKVFSDVVDDAGHQYIDLVMEGGGVLGIALTGYTYILEQAGLRFLGVGGASAGAVNALVISTIDRPEAAKSAKLAQILAEMPMQEFMDGGKDAQDFTRAMLEKADLLRMFKEAIFVIDELNDDLGLHPADAFTTWLRQSIAGHGGPQTLDELRQFVAQPVPGLRRRDGAPFDGPVPGPTLALVAADVTTETKVVFPDMAPLYWKKSGEVPIAAFARASMSVPYFFQPFRSGLVPWDAESRRLWQDKAGYPPMDLDTLAPEARESAWAQWWPQRCLFIDGGIVSNFPIDVFHRPERQPTRPTFGAKIGYDRKPVNIHHPGQLGGAIFNSARHVMDYDFIRRNPDYKKLVAFIDVEDKHDWLNFNLADDAKLDLFASGAETAAAFLCRFNWEDYKALREKIVGVQAEALRQKNKV
jgi:NTE family protein